MRKKLNDYRWCSKGSTIRLTRLDLIHMFHSSRSMKFNEEKFNNAYTGNSKLTYRIYSYEKIFKKISLLRIGKKELKNKPIFNWEIAEQNTFLDVEFEEGESIFVFNPAFVSFGSNGKYFPDDLQLYADSHCLICNAKSNKRMEVIDIGDRYECICADCYNNNNIYKYYTKEELIITLLNIL